MQDTTRQENRLPSLETIAAIMEMMENPDIQTVAMEIAKVTNGNLAGIRATIIREKLLDTPLFKKHP